MDLDDNSVDKVPRISPRTSTIVLTATADLFVLRLCQMLNHHGCISQQLVTIVGIFVDLSF